mgnify:FL=1|tara:strand:- start:1 stop:246 length:246 start_codon:yes stop_codon:yes gene_type:complete
MAKSGRPKLIGNMEPWELAEHNRREAVKQLTPEQVKAISETQEALREFMEQWSENFDICDPDLPRKLQSAFYRMHNYFPQH